MSKRTHEKQLARARAKRRAERRMIRRRRLRIVAIAVVVTLVGSLLAVGLFSGRDDDPEPGDEAAEEQTAPDATEAAAGPCADVDTPAPPEPRLEPYDSAPEMAISPDDQLTATIATTCGDITIELFAADAPTAVNNFVFLARDDYYRGVPFHRVRADFVIQAGDPTGTGTGCVDQACETRLPGYTFEDELGRAEQIVEAEGGYPRGTVAMANAGPDTNGSQFFIVQGALAPLSADFTVLGQVTSGMDVVDDITAGETGDQLTDPEHILDVTIDAGPAGTTGDDTGDDTQDSPSEATEDDTPTPAESATDPGAS